MHFHAHHIVITSCAALHWCQGGHRTTLTWKKKLLHINFKSFMIFLPSKKICDNPKFFRLNKIKLWTKFGNKLGCKLSLQLHLIFFFYWMWILTNPSSAVNEPSQTWTTRARLDKKLIHVCLLINKPSLSLSFRLI